MRVSYLPNRQVIRPYQIIMYFVYILRNKSRSFLYTGYSSDIERRIESHNVGNNRTTKKYLPLELIYYEAYCNESDARKRERFLKSGRGRDVIRKQLDNTLRI